MSTTYNCVHYDRNLMRSCIYGLAVGDALGVPYEFCGRVLRFRGNPAEVDRPAAWQSRNRAMYLER